VSISIVVVRGIAEELSRRGIDSMDLLEAVGVPSSSVDDPSARLTTDQYVAFVDLAIDRARDPSLGLHVGANAHATVHVIGHAALACVTLRDAAQLFLRYAPLIAESVEYTAEVRGDLAMLSYSNRALPRRTASFGAEYALAMLHSMLARFVPGALAREVRFRHRPLADIATYRNVFGCEVRFSANDDTLVIDAEYLDIRQHHADPPLVSLLRDRAETMLSSITVRERLPSRIREMVRSAASPAELGVETIAETLGVGARTLRRRLGHGGGVRAIVASTKREIAEELLRDDSVTIKEISYRLGFSEPSAFHRAFKRWTKMTPVDFRTAVRGTGNVVELPVAPRDTVLDAPRQRAAQ